MRSGRGTAGRKITRRVLALFNWSTPEMTRGVVEYARSAGWWLDTPFVAWWGGTPPEAVLPSPANPFDGMLTLFLYLPPEVSEAITRLSLPVVSLSGTHPPDTPRVTANNKTIAQLAAKAFLERKFKHVTFIGGRGHPEAEARCNSFIKAAVEGGASMSTIPYELSPITDYGKSATLAGWLAKLPKPIGIMAFSDKDASRIVYACQIAGLAIPEQVAVIGVGNDAMICEQEPVSLSSVMPNDYGLGQKAAALLDELMHGGTAPPDPVYVEPLGVMHRQSTDVLAVPDVNVARALRYIWQNSSNPRLGVPEVAAFVGVSVSTLNNGFIRHLGTPIGWQIRQRRLTQAMKMLKEGNTKIRDIAVKCGYRDTEHLRSTMMLKTGQSPRAWRRKTG